MALDRIELKDYLRETNLIHSRLVALGVLLIVLTTILLLRVWYLQIYNNERFELLSKDNRVRLVPMPPVRGQIFDRNGKVLAENIPVFTLEIVPKDVDNMDVLLDEITKIIEVSPSDVRKFRAAVKSHRGFEPQVLKVNLNDQEVARFSVNQYRFRGAKVQARLQRNYPYAGEMAHVLGYVGRISQRDKESIDAKAYKGTDYIGKRGIEARYEDQLLGRVGVEQVETNAHGQPIRSLNQKRPVSGDDLYLNIDVELQIKAREYLGDKRGSVIAIEPATGEILAFVSNPVFDPNKFVNGIDHRSFNALRDDPNRPLVNRTISGRYAPGSTIKGLISLAALENGWNENTHIYCPGFFKLKGSSHRYRCWKRAGHGSTSLLKSIMQSCDVYYYQLANTIGIDKLSAFLKNFGLGSQTGVDLDGEPSGLVPSREWKRGRRGVAWYPGDTLNIGIGQGDVLATPLQLGVMTATLANRGKRIEPRLVGRLESSDIGKNEKVITKLVGSELGVVEANSKNFDVIIDAMEAVVGHARGTAYNSVGKGAEYTMAGKTGTAQVVAIPQGARYDASKLTDFQKDHALFVAFAPIKEPKIAIAVIVENGGSGSSAAAPVARKVADYYLLNKDANASEVELELIPLPIEPLANLEARQ